MTEKIYLGISLGFNSSAAVVSNTRGLLAAVSQERLSGVKNTKEIPFLAMIECLKIANVKSVEKICISHYQNIDEKYFEKYSSCQLDGATWKEYILNFLKSENINVIDTDIIRVDHHTAHQFSTFGFYGKPNNVDYHLISSDGFGDGISARITHALGGKKSDVKLENSVALVYQFVTGALGFKEHQHEGKITGLAAYGKPIYLSKFYDCFKKSDDGNFLSFDNKEFLTPAEMRDATNSPIIDFDRFLLLKKTIYNLVADLLIDGATREDISASVQQFAEDVTLKWIKSNCEPGGDAYLSGGLFANVKINQRIKDAGIFNNVYVCPAMGDEGTAVGCAIYEAMVHGFYNDNVKEIGASKKVISGSGLDNDLLVHKKIQNALVNMGLEEKYKVKLSTNTYDVINKIVKCLSEDKIVCLMTGKMEFGPRALCHRSILYNATNKETNDSLNARLSRSEFMPFAPVCKEEMADELFKNLNGGRDSAKFMTMTFDGTDEFVNTYKAVAHVDGTARPQIVSKADDMLMWRILTGYALKTGLKCLVNTSFNLHEQPIIRDEIAGLNSFVKADLDVLVVGNVVVEKV